MVKVVGVLCPRTGVVRCSLCDKDSVRAVDTACEACVSGSEIRVMSGTSMLI